MEQRPTTPAAAAAPAPAAPDGTSPPGPREAPRGADPRHGVDFRFKVWDRVLATVSVLFVVFGGLGGLYTHFDELRKEREQRSDEWKKEREQRDQELAQRQREYELQLHKEKVDMYRGLCAATGRIAGAKRLKDAEKSIEDFWAYYFGDLHTVKDPEVQKAKNEFGAILNECDEDAPPPAKLCAAALHLAETCQNSLALEKAYGIPPAGQGEAAPPKP